MSERYELSDITDLPYKVASLNKEGATLAERVNDGARFFQFSSLPSLVHMEFTSETFQLLRTCPL